MRSVLISRAAAVPRRNVRAAAAVTASLSLAMAACGSDDPDAAADDSEPSVTERSPETEAAVDSDEEAELPTIVVSTNVLGDVVGNVVGDEAEIVTIMPVGADPHDFQASAREIDVLMAADALIVNGGDYEEGLVDVIASAVDDGVPTFEALSAVETIEYADDEHSDGDHDEHDDEHSDGDHDEHGGDAHSDDEHDEHSDDEHDEHSDDEHDEHSDDDHHHHHSGEDPHFFTDPVRMAAAVDGIVGFLRATVDFADPTAVDASAEAYLDQLAALDADVAGMVAGLADDRRVLVTNHQVFGYFADRYDFEVIGAVIPSGTTLDAASGGDLADLAELIDAENVPAIFSDTSASDELIQTLASEVGDVAVVALYTESLGEPGSAGGTYVDMVRTNSERIVGALS